MIRLSKFRWIIVVACVTHVFWGIILIGWGNVEPPGPANINALAHLSAKGRIPGSVLGAALLTIALMALIPMIKKTEHSFQALLLVIPQQLIMLFSAFAAIESAVLQQFADGAHYPWYFIAADQCWHVFNGIGHTFALWEIYSFIGLKKVSDDNGP